MADKNKIAEMLESLVNNDTAKAEDIFHEYVVEKSREIYENLIESELDEESTDEEVDESMDDEDDMDESFDVVDEAGDETDDMMGDIEDHEEPDDDNMGGPSDHDEDNEEEDGEPATKGDVQDLTTAIDELQAAFDQFLQGEEHEEEEMPGIHGDHEMGGEEEMGDSFGMDQVEDLSTVREYVERVSDGHGAEKKSTPSGKMAGAGTGEMGGQRGEQNMKSPVAGKNDMGGTTANIAKGGVEPEGASTKGGLANPSTKEENFGNINVPGGKAGKTAFTHKEPGHGAEKKGGASGEMAGARTGEMGGQRGEQNTQSLFRGKK
jgi:hypothetical protein